MTGNKRRWLLFAGVATLAGATGALFGLKRLGGARDEIAKAMMAIRLPDLKGEARSLEQWRGQVLVVNLWATWCVPCREEIPVFVKLQDKYRERGLQIIGIAIDRRDSVQTFAHEFGINYPLLLGGIEVVELSRQTGNRVGALPFTLIFDRSARIVATSLGQIKEISLENSIKPLL